MRRTLVAILVAALCSCSGIDAAPAKAMRDAIRPEHMAYVEADPGLDAEQRARRARTWAAFDAWIRALEGEK